jgi:hypothetical protein
MTFYCKYPQGLYWLIPSRVQFTQFGERHEVPGKSIQFSGGMYDTEDEEEIGLIQKLREFGTEITVKGKNEPSRAGTLQQNQEETASENVGPTGCPKCTFKAATPQGLKIHINEKHGK